jgi:hypothetical protein
VSFEPRGSGTHRRATLDVPVRGVNRRRRPLIARASGHQPPAQRDVPKAASAA